MEKENTNYMYYARALAILLVVFNHIGFSGLKYLGLFAMPLFFFQSGWFYRPNKKTFQQELVSSFKKLMIPFYSFMALYAVIGTIRALFFGYNGVIGLWDDLANTIWGSGYVPTINENIKEVLEAGRPFVKSMAYTVDAVSPVNCHLWFLPAMFTARLLFCALEPKVKKPTQRILAILILVALAGAESVMVTKYQMPQFPLGLGRGCMGAAFMFAGLWLKEKEWFSKETGKQRLLSILISFGTIVLATVMKSSATGLVSSYYGPYGLFSTYLSYLGGLGSVIIGNYLCKLIEQKSIPALKHVLLVIGKNTLSIYLWHFAIKALLDILYALFLGYLPSLDKYMVGMLPKEDWLFMLVEGIACVVLCTLWGIRPKKAQH